ncbi:MAG: polysaccharide biosynthesis protein [Gammaproteobacteria bacterium]|nr:polysaccharide biosynthesis protein [Gammaproteobacteria bacterium]
MEILKKQFRRLSIVVAHDVFMVSIAWVIANWLLFSFNLFAQDQIISILRFLPVIVVIQAFFYWYFGLYRGIWRFASLPDLVRIIEAVALSSVVSLGTMFFIDRLSEIPRALFPLYTLILIFLLGGSRLLYRYFKDRGQLSFKGKRALIIGAGKAGEMLVRDLLRSTNHNYKPIAFVDDDPTKIGKEIHGVRIIGASCDIKRIVNKKSIDAAIIALPSAKSSEMQRIVNLCREVKLPFQTVPSLSELTSGKVPINSLREVAVEDLLGREQVEIDWDGVRGAIENNVVLISGGGGSIGSEICRQVAKLNPKSLIIIENSEYNLYQLEGELKNNFPQLNFIKILGSVVDSLLVEKVFGQYQPKIVFHAAAYKHVPILEDQIYAAVRNNILGTITLAENSIAVGVKKFVLISTDKAVRPTNVMGATKRFAEMICQHYGQNNLTKFITVRFGNVLGSSGSVVPLFRKQLAAGGPITVTHPEITRFFMTISEAVCLILQACAFGRGSEIFVLDMGEPVKISYLAEQIIKLSGKEPGVDVEIVYSGLRPGEKLYEELFYSSEESMPTLHEKIRQAKYQNWNWGMLAEVISDLKSSGCFEDHENNLKKILLELVPEYQPSIKE